MDQGRQLKEEFEHLGECFGHLAEKGMPEKGGLVGEYLEFCSGHIKYEMSARHIVEGIEKAVAHVILERIGKIGFNITLGVIVLT